jgi:transposase
LDLKNQNKELKSAKTVMPDDLRRLAEENRRLREKAGEPKKTSVNSSNAPSNDFFPPAKGLPEPKPKGKPGARKGHKAHHRSKPKPAGKKSAQNKGKVEELAVTAIDLPTEECVIEPAITGCPDCGCQSQRHNCMDNFKEQIELVDNPFVRKLYHLKAHRCPVCGKIHRGGAPASLGTGLLGPELISYLMALKGTGHVSISGIQSLLKTFGLTLCRGAISQYIGKGAKALDKSYCELKEALAGQRVLNIDGTGHKENGKRLWTWAFRAKDFACFAIKLERAASVLFEHLGEKFSGTIGSDYYGAYRKFLRKSKGVTAQFCLAHLKRDLVCLVDHVAEPELGAYGSGLLGILTELFDKVRLFRRLKAARAPDYPDDPELEGGERLEAAQKTLEDMRSLAARFKEAALAASAHKKAKNMAKRFLDWPQDPYFTLLTDDGVELGVEPTNNSAERTVRFVVIDRHVTQGTRSPRGRHDCGRIWSTIASCSIQGRSAFDFIKDSIMARYCGAGEYPSFLTKNGKG